MQIFEQMGVYGYDVQNIKFLQTFQITNFSILCKIPKCEKLKVKKDELMNIPENVGSIFLTPGEIYSWESYLRGHTEVTMKNCAMGTG